MSSYVLRSGSLILKSIFFVSCLFFFGFEISAQSVMDLSGNWKVRLDSLDTGIKNRYYEKSDGETIKLPGTLDDAKIGAGSHLSSEKISRDVLLNLTRKHSYVGPAWYSKEIVIPSGWKGKLVNLLLERVIWDTHVWIDGVEAGSQESLSTPHKYDLSQLLKPGKHIIVIRVDNRKKYDIGNMAHAYTDGTQIIWNGVIGKMQLVAKDKLHIENLQLFPNVLKHSVTVTSQIQNLTASTVNASLAIEVYDKNKKKVTGKNLKVSLEEGISVKQVSIPLGKNAVLWDEFNPNLYTIKIRVNSGKLSHRVSEKFGLKEIKTKNTQILINGRPSFFRGTLESAIFPLTGYPPMEKKGWIKVFSSAISYGLNHIRFHSWCPPKAAFEVADSLGIYLQVELPLWSLQVGKDSSINTFLEHEADRIYNEYGNHPSFSFFSLGNELEGDFNWLSNLLERLKKRDARRLYTTTTFTFQKGHGRWPEKGDDYFITQYTLKGWVRGQGIFNDFAPNFSTDYTKAVDSLTVPIITHEIGQYSVYPNLKEIKKYTGVLDPLNFKAVRNDLKKKNMLSLADSFTLASGKFSANLCKEEIERALKTKGVSGFQLLDLHDFPGQGTALVGILDAFWESKGILKPEEHRAYNSSIVPLLRFSKAVYTNNEQFDVEAEIANFSQETLKGVITVLNIRDASGNVLYQTETDPGNIPVGNGNIVGKFTWPLKNIKVAEQLTIELLIKNSNVKNSWVIWVYPENLNLNSDIVFTTSFSEAISKLKEGRKVLFSPDTSKIRGVQGRFAPVFWSPVHFPNQPGTMGLLCDPKHPVFGDFPTDFYSNWQWWDLVTSSKTMVIDSIPQINPLVRVIDNFFKNRKMAAIIEAKFGNGKLIVSSMNLSENLQNRPAARQLRYSLENYMKSEKFNPVIELDSKQLSFLIDE